MHHRGSPASPWRTTRDLSQATPRTSAAVRQEDPPATADVETLLRAETARVVRGRLDVTVALLIGFVGISVFLEQRAHPERAWPVTATYLAEIAVALVAVTACRVRRLAGHTVAIAAAMASLLGVMNGVYIRLLGGDLESLAMAQVCLMTGLAVMVPWGWRAQVVVCTASLGGFFLAESASVPPPEPWAVLGVWVGALTSCIGVVALDRSRRAAFVRAVLLGRLSAQQRDEAEVAGALARVSRELSELVGQAGVLDAVNRLAVEILGCDWSATLVPDRDRWGPTLVPDRDGGRFRFVAEDGLDATARAELGNVALPLAELPLFARFRRGGLVEIDAADRDGLLPDALRERWAMASALWIPVYREAGIGAIIVAGCRTPRRASEKQRRLALGIADAVAIALENERLIGDLQEANRLKSDFVTTISHELRTPLNVILGYTEMLADAERASGIASLARRIRTSAIGLLGLVESTLDLARLEAGRDVIELEPVDVGALCAEVRDELEPARVKSRATLVVPPCSGESHVVSDRAKLRTIVRNLVDNAFKYGRHGTVELRTRAAGGWLEIVVRDDGAGIAEHDLPAIFEMFRQLDSASTHPFGGVGLGLYIVRQLVERLGGTVAVDSALGVGSTFTVRVPAAAAAAGAQVSPAAAAG